VLPDGTIGIYYEVGEYEIYQMYFVRFSLDWLTDGADHFSPVGIDDNGMDQGNLRVYPNPTGGVIHISAESHTGDFLALSDIDGRLLYTEKIENLNGSQCAKEFDLGRFSPGFYFLRVGNDVTRIVRQ
jgi:hypothetical protein